MEEKETEEAVKEVEQEMPKLATQAIKGIMSLIMGLSGEVETLGDECVFGWQRLPGGEVEFVVEGLEQSICLFKKNTRKNPTKLDCLICRL
ncbi:MAG: hypothetical protein ACFE7E_03470 [Candidatus Hodarchaeota archaeon]